MTKQNYNKAATLIIRLIVLNNAGGVARAFKAAGYDTKNFIPAPELEANLLQLLMTDEAKFYEIMKNVSWNYGDTNTNKPEIKQQLIDLTGMQDNAQAKGEWWKALLALLQGHSPSQPAPAPAPAPQTNTGIIIALAVVAIAVIIGIIYLFRS